MTQEDEQKLDELMQMAQMGSMAETVTPGYGLYPVGDQGASTPTTFPSVPMPTVSQ